MAALFCWVYDSACALEYWPMFCLRAGIPLYLRIVRRAACRVFGIPCFLGFYYMSAFLPCAITHMRVFGLIGKILTSGGGRRGVN